LPTCQPNAVLVTRFHEPVAGWFSAASETQSVLPRHTSTLTGPLQPDQLTVSVSPKVRDVRESDTVPGCAVIDTA
jgi:hypothetical protein